MKPFRSLIFAGAVVAAAVGVAAAAQEAKLHVLKLRLPDGVVEVIRYSGDVAPQVTLSDRPLPAAFAAFPMDPAATDPAAFGWDAPFAMMQRIQADLQRQTAAMLQQARAMQAAAGSDPQQLVAFGAPGGGQSFLFVSTASSSGFCGRSVQITSFGDGKPAKVVSKTFGSCGASMQGPRAYSTAASLAPTARHADSMPVETAPQMASSGQPTRIGV